MPQIKLKLYTFLIFLIAHLQNPIHQFLNIFQITHKQN